jgi:hypothetical protein
MIRPDIRQRFRAVVARAIEHSEREQREHLQRLRSDRGRDHAERDDNNDVVVADRYRFDRRARRRRAANLSK